MCAAKLFGLTKKGGFKVWNIEVVSDQIDGGEYQNSATIVIDHGQEGGVMTPVFETIYTGKQGRTPYEQAVSVAQGKLKKQIDKGYRYTKAELEELPLLAMLAGDYKKVGHLIDWNYGVDIFDKYDGVRMLAKCQVKGTVTLESRTGQKYSLPHIEEELAIIMETGEVLDAEIYLHGYILQDITSAVKRTDTQAAIDKAQRQIEKKGPDYRKPSDDSGIINPTALEELLHATLIHDLRPQLQFIAFDLPSDKIWADRLEELREYSGERFLGEFVHRAGCTRVHSEETMLHLHKNAVERAYEGVMLRNRDGLYESGKRSSDLQKFKTMISSEFLILDMIADKNGNGIYVCKNDLNDRKFQVVYGSLSERLEALNNKFSVIGSYLTVDFQSRYKDTLIAQFPVGKGVRKGVVVDGVFIPSE